MARGGRRPGAGRKRKQLAERVVEGVFPSARPSNLAVLSMPQVEGDWQPTPADVAGLGPTSQAWLAAVLADYQLTELEGLELLMALRALTTVEDVETSIRVGGLTAGHSAALARGQRMFLALWTPVRARLEA